MRRIPEISGEKYAALCRGAEVAAWEYDFKNLTLPNVKFAVLIDPSVLMSERIQIGEGGIVCAGSILTVDIKPGCHSIINLNCTIWVPVPWW